MKIETTPTRLEEILERKFDIGHRRLLIRGSSSPLSLAYFLSQSYSKRINDLPHVVVTSSTADAERFLNLVEFFDPQRQASLLPAFDVSPYSGLYPSPQVTTDRLRFLSRACHAKPRDLFVATGTALAQNTLPKDIFKTLFQQWKVGDELPADLNGFLSERGYQSAPLVEDIGQYAVRGGIVDIWSPAHTEPVRIELFGDQIESLRTFHAQDQRSSQEIRTLDVSPARETLFLDENYEKLIERLRADLSQRSVEKSESDELIRSLVLKQSVPGMEFLLPFFYDRLEHPLLYFPGPVNLWILDSESIERAGAELATEWAADEKATKQSLIHPHLETILAPFQTQEIRPQSRQISFSLLDELERPELEDQKVDYRTFSVQDFAGVAQSTPFGGDLWFQTVGHKLTSWRNAGYRVFVATRNTSSTERLALALERMGLKSERVGPEDYSWDEWLQEQEKNPSLIHLIPRASAESLRFEEERIAFLRDDDFFGKKERRQARRAEDDFQKQARLLSFGDLNPNDLVVHVQHGIGRYEGLKIMNINGADSEFIQVAYKDADRLYLPVYRIGQLQKYSGAATTTILDKLGGTGWEKTKSKVRSHLRDLAADLLALYAKRAELHRSPFRVDEEDVLRFENGFPYDETEDQHRAIQDIRRDLDTTKPMDRLICGDVGFGKTEVAMRAAFFAVQSGKQVALLAPTTVLTFQHYETFKKRFEGWPVQIRVLNRFVSNVDAKKVTQETKEGKVDILIGTHRLLSKDVAFKDLGLLMVDEEQKFGVAHKEKIRKIKTSVDTLALSATPIPRTLNMSLVGIRDLSLINTAPVDRLPTRTFICKWETETIRKSIQAEIARGGQIYFIHNRIQSIYGLADELRQIVPEARLRVAHGQMEEEELEKTMLAFFHHEIDLLVCTAIVESGMDVPRANTMFIDRADMFGVSQLYQLRGRVGRSKLRAYCYLLLPKDRKLDKDAQERLRIIQENTALGSGLRIAQHDLELRGSGTLLGEEQSGHVDSVGYEMYMELLKEALSEAKGETPEEIELDPEINLRTPALIPDSYISDVRIRLSYYKALAEIRSEDDLTKIEEELRDQFGPIPDPVVNLMGLMLIRRQCKDLGVRDVSAGVKTISLIFTPRTRLKPETVIQLAMRENKKYSVTPDHRLNIRLNNITWTGVYEELNQLLKMI